MSQPVIRVDSLGKLYRLGERERYSALRDVLARPFSSFSRRKEGPKRAELWAVKNLSFEVREGEVLGLIGRNGAGKSTLLKILSRITKPTEGSAEIRGRVGSLLEVGTGFHPELTGRENVFLNGAILGMSKREIQRKFDEIVAFAEVERFLDTPLKYYSSGMQVRLAFAVAAHLEPEILFVDEVLSVGDISFQKKCLGKMGDVANQGRTIIFVSHQMAQIRRLCSRGIWIESGAVRMHGLSQEIVSAYEAAVARGSRSVSAARAHDLVPRTSFVRWEIASPQRTGTHILDTLEPVTIRFVVDVRQPMENALQGMALYDHERRLIWSKAPENISLEPGQSVLDYTFPMLPLRAGLYIWAVTLYDHDWKLVDAWDCEPEMHVTTESHQTPLDEWTGILNMPCCFKSRSVTA